MGFILGPPMEYAFGQTVILAQSNLLGYIAVERPITLVIFLMTPILTYLMWRRSVRLRQKFGVEE